MSETKYNVICIEKLAIPLSDSDLHYIVEEESVWELSNFTNGNDIQLLSTEVSLDLSVETYKKHFMLLVH